jgi:hypothetical protein
MSSRKPAPKPTVERVITTERKARYVVEIRSAAGGSPSLEADVRELSRKGTDAVGGIEV